MGYKLICINTGVPVPKTQRPFTFIIISLDMHFLRSVAIVATVLTFGSVVMAAKATDKPAETAAAEGESPVSAKVVEINKLVTEGKRYGKAVDLLKKKSHWDSLLTLKDVGAAAEMIKLFTAINTNLAKLYTSVKADGAGPEALKIRDAQNKVITAGTLANEKAAKDMDLKKYVDDVAALFAAVSAFKTKEEANKLNMTGVKSVDDLVTMFVDPLKALDTKDLKDADKANVKAVIDALGTWSECEGEGWGTLTIVLIIVAVIALIAIIVLVVYFFVLKRK